MIEDASEGFWVGDFFADPSNNRLSKDGGEIALEPKVMEVLVQLALADGRVVSRDEFLETVWAGMVVTEDVLSRCISELRRILDDSAREPRYIETVRKVGYRLVAPVKTGDAPPLRNNWSATEVVEPDKVATNRQSKVALVVSAVAAVVLIGWLTVLDSSDETPAERAISILPGVEVDPAFSPDGLSIAYAADGVVNRDFDIYVRRGTDGSPSRLTDSRLDDRFPAWSPDGSELAFVRFDREGAAVFIISATGGPERKVVELGSRQVQGVSWSPDGSRLAVSLQRRAFGPYGIFFVELDSVRVEPVTDPPRTSHGDTWPVFSPTGEKIAFARGPFEHLKNVFVAHVDSGSTRQVTFDSIAVKGIDWTPDGQSLLLAGRGNSGYGIWRVGLQSSELSPVVSAKPGERLWNPSVSKASNTLSYVRQNSAANIWRLPMVEGRPGREEQVIASDHGDWHPDVNHSGNLLAFTSSRSGDREIWTTEDGGKTVKQLTTIGRALHPSWSATGEEVAFDAVTRGQSDVFVVSEPTGQVRRLTTSEAEDVAPTWSRDGRFIYFASDRTGDWQIWRVPVAGGPEVQVTTIGARYAVEATDGSRLFFVRTDTVGIWARSPKPGPERPELITAGLDSPDWANWALLDGAIAHVDRSVVCCSLAIYDLNRDSVEKLFDLGRISSGRSLSAAGNGSSVVYSRYDIHDTQIVSRPLDE